MKKGFLLLFSLPVFGLIIGGTMWRNANSFAQMVTLPREGDDGGGTTIMTWKLDLIDEKAEQAKSNEESAVRALADEVFKSPELAVIPTEDREAMKARVLSHELAYRSGKSEGIKEGNVVLTVNELADKFAAPDFARTSALQVRVLRASFLKDYPNFIAQETSGGGKISQASIGDSVSPTMSPLEAVYVTGVMLWQKVLNENYQHAPQEWVNEVYNRQLAQWQADTSGSPAPEQGSDQVGYHLEVRESSAKSKQMMSSITTGAFTLLAADAQGLSSSPNLYDATLDTLGIKQREESR
ncbi:MAG TPA: hypothetical protein VF708_10445 [Pyrinomonadaceae bacterium]|jgi:hypothetical protein